MSAEYITGPLITHYSALSPVSLSPITMNIQSLFALLAALFGGLLSMQLVGQLQRADLGSAKGLADFTGQAEAPTFVERLGAVFLRVAQLDWASWYQHLRWAQLGERGQPPTLARVIGSSLLYGAIGLGVMFLTRAPILGLGALFAAALPLVQLRSKADGVRRQVRRALPEMAALAAAEMAANNPPELALLRAAELPGPLALLVSEAVQQSRRTGRPLFSRRPVTGMLVETVRAWDLPALNTFARQIDLAAAKGVAGAEQMNRAAKGLTREYREELLRRAEKLESDLVVPGMLFVFMPFLIAVIATIGLPILRAF